eukprot:scaffold125405_cov62-Phaeocystis_antarctica.AAC.1
MTTATLTADWLAYAEVCTCYAPAPRTRTAHPPSPRTPFRAACTAATCAIDALFRHCGRTADALWVHRSTAATVSPPAAPRRRRRAPTPRRGARRYHATRSTRARCPAGRSRSSRCRLSRHRTPSRRVRHGATLPCGLRDAPCALRQHRERSV